MSKYVIYARKSTESEDRQVLSIDSQINELKAVATRYGVSVAEVQQESMSAKAPGRPVFSKLMEDVEAGKIAGILCWKLDRLARNPVDGGRIIWGIKNNNLRILTPGQTYSALEENTILMYVEFGMAQKYIDDLGKNVRRGNKAKLEMGWLPGSAPFGYINKLDDHTIIPDPERFPLIRKMWDMLLSGAYSPVQIREIANNEWGFRSRKTKRNGGKPMGHSSIYRLFKNPFYYGVLDRMSDGQRVHCPGSHQPMITEKEFWDAQRILGNPAPRPHNKEFAFTGIMHCGQCGCSITAEEKVKKSGLRYTYYRCTKRKENTVCDQKCSTDKDIQAQLADPLQKMRIPQPFVKWAIKQIREVNQDESSDRTHVYVALQGAYNDVQAKLDRLLDLRLRDLVTDEEFTSQKGLLQIEQSKIREKLGDTEQRAENWIEKVEEAFDFALHAAYWLEHGTLTDKRRVAIRLGSNYILKDKKLTFLMGELWEAFSNASEKLHSDVATLELLENGEVNEKTTEFSSVILSWQGRRESNPRKRFWRPLYYHYTTPL